SPMWRFQMSGHDQFTLLTPSGGAVPPVQYLLKVGKKLRISLAANSVSALFGLLGRLVHSLLGRLLNGPPGVLGGLSRGFSRFFYILFGVFHIVFCRLSKKRYHSGAQKKGKRNCRDWFHTGVEARNGPKYSIPGRCSISSKRLYFAKRSDRVI